jgi:hypothetical protein
MRKVLFRLLPSILILFCLERAGRSQDIRAILGKNYDVFPKIASMSFSATQDCIIQLPGPQFGKKITDTIEFESSGNKFAYSIEQSSDLPGNHHHFDSAAFDGEYLQALHGGTLAIKAGYPISIPALSQELYLLTPYTFVEAVAAAAPENKGNKNFVLTPYQFIKPQYWTALQGRIKSIQSGSLEGKQGVLMSISGKLWGEDVDMSVLFDPTQNFYPVAWERSTSRGFKQSYVVSDLEYARSGAISFPYPKTAILTKYAGSVPGSICTISVNNVSINDIDLSDSRFTIDPGQASFINDLDKKVLIPVPK